MFMFPLKNLARKGLIYIFLVFLTDDAVRLPPTSVTKDGQIPVTILGLDLDESIEEQRFVVTFYFL